MRDSNHERFDVRGKRCGLALLLLLAMSGCAHIQPMDKTTGFSREVVDGRDNVTIFGNKGLVLLGKEDAAVNSSEVLSYNAYLWQASLDELSSMGLDKKDDRSGCLETAWYSSPVAPNVRTKVFLSIVGKDLLLKNVILRVKEQSLIKGGWRDVKSLRVPVNVLRQKIFKKAQTIAKGL